MFTFEEIERIDDFIKRKKKTLPGDIIEESLREFLSGAGGALARRRRKLSSRSRFICNLFRSLCNLFILLAFLFRICFPLELFFSMPTFYGTSEFLDRTWWWLPANHLLDLLRSLVLKLAKEKPIESKCSPNLKLELSLQSSSKSMEFRCFVTLVVHCPHRSSLTATSEPAMKMAAEGLSLTLIQMLFSSHGLDPQFGSQLFRSKKPPVSAQLKK